MVIAIIAILAGLLLPAFAKTKSNAQRQVRQQPKQIGLGMWLWTDEHGGKYP